MTCEDGGRESVTILAGPMDEIVARACDALREWLRGGEWPDDGCRVYGEYAVYRGDVEVIPATGLTVTIDPDEDALMCEAGVTVDCDHDWRPTQLGCDQNPGVHGSDHGGVSISTTCAVCGAVRVEDTGATDDSGQRCTRITYSMPD